MERRHQVFISSTYRDLEEERKHIIHALLELDCIPAGMELFPASDEDAWNLIKSVIDDSDYYLLVISGRYGSVDKDGISFTEKEYDYAVSAKKPVMAFLHGDLSAIPKGKSETSEIGQTRLEAFRKKVEEAKHCKYWKTPEELGGTVSRSLIQLRKKYPSDGWVPGKYAAEETTLLELTQLRIHVKELEDQLTAYASGKAAFSLDTSELAQGDDKISLHTSFLLKNPAETKKITLEVTWNTIISYVGPSLIGECDEETLNDKIRLAYWHETPKNLVEREASYEHIILPYVLFDQIKIQLRALGVMVPGLRRRPIADKKVYWCITPAGEALLIRLQALKRGESYK